MGVLQLRKIVVEPCRAIATHLLSIYVFIPSGEKLKEVVDGFEEFWGFPQVAGAIEGTHVPIICPDESASDYYNRNGITPLLCKVWWTITVCLWMHALVGREKHMMRECMLTPHYTTKE